MPYGDDAEGNGKKEKKRRIPLLALLGGGAFLAHRKLGGAAATLGAFRAAVALDPDGARRGGFGRYYLVHAATYVPAATRHGRGSRALWDACAA